MIDPAKLRPDQERQRLELVVEGTRLGLWDWNPLTGEVVFNSIWTEMLGYSLDEIDSSVEEWESRVHPDDLEACFTALTDHIEGRTPFYENVHRMRHRDGHWVHILDRGKIVERDEAGRPIRFTGTHTDISPERDAMERLAERTGMMREVLDHVRTGLLRIDLDGIVQGERSRVIDEWLPGLDDGRSLPEVLAAAGAPNEGEVLELGLLQLQDHVLPRHVLIRELPKRITVGPRILSVSYVPIEAQQDRPERLLVVVDDITEQVARDRAEAAQLEMLELFRHFVRSRSGFEAFLSEARRHVAALVAPTTDVDTQQRLLHTLKGNTMFFGLDRMAFLCHDLESLVADRLTEGLLDVERERLGAMWIEVEELADPILAYLGSEKLQVGPDDLALLARIGQGTEVERWIDAIRLEPVQERLEQLSAQAVALAKRLGLPEPVVVVDSGGVRLAPRHWDALWSSMIHAIRNALDHGFEPAQERRRAGKPPAWTLRLLARVHGSGLELVVEDDGRGIDWQRLEARARDLGLPTGTQADLEAALWASGVSCRDQVTVTSGRGVGLAALKTVTEQLGGSVGVTSRPGLGTRLTFSFPQVERIATLLPPTGD